MPKVVNPDSAKDDMSAEAFELLCILPLEPCYVTIADVVSELGFDRENIKACLNEIRAAGIRPITIWGTKMEKGLKTTTTKYAIDSKYWDRARELGTKYWNTRDTPNNNNDTTNNATEVKPNAYAARFTDNDREAIRQGIARLIDADNTLTDRQIGWALSDALHLTIRAHNVTRYREQLGIANMRKRLGIKGYL